MPLPASTANLQDALHRALHEGDTEKAQALIFQGARLNADVDMSDNPVCSALMGTAPEKALEWIAAPKTDWIELFGQMPHLFDELRGMGLEKTRALLWKKLEGREDTIWALVQLYHAEERGHRADESPNRALGKMEYRCSASAVAGDWIGEMAHLDPEKAKDFLKKALDAGIVTADGLWRYKSAWLNNPRFEASGRALGQICPPPPQVVWGAHGGTWNLQNPPSPFLLSLMSQAVMQLRPDALLYHAYTLVDAICIVRVPVSTEPLESFCKAIQDFPRLVNVMRKLPAERLRGICLSAELVDVWQRYIQPLPLANTTRAAQTGVVEGGEVKVLEIFLEQNPGPYEPYHALGDLPEHVAKMWDVETMEAALEALEKGGFDLNDPRHEIEAHLGRRGCGAIVDKRRAGREMEVMEAQVPSKDGRKLRI